MNPEAAPWNSTDGGRCFLEMIPIEILTELLTNLDFQDIFRVRKTCKLLRQAANLPKPYWVNLLYQHAWQLPLRLERPLDLYSAEEVERVALQRISADRGWSSPVRQRTITRQGALLHHLVEGGRWLLVVTDTGSISYFDLEDARMEERVLVPDQIFVGRKVKQISMDVDVDLEEPILTFNIALDITAKFGPEEPSTSTIQIIRVALELDTDNRGIGLSATVLATFLRKTGKVQSISLIGRVIAYLINHPDAFFSYVVVINWVKAFAHVQTKGKQSLSYMKRIICIKDHQELVRLVPGNMIVVTGRRWEGLRLQLYDALDLPVRRVPAPAAEDTEEPTSPIWTALFQTGKECPWTHFLSKPYRFPAPDVDPGIVRLMVRTQTGLHVVNIREPSEKARAAGKSSLQSTPNIVSLIDGYLQKNGKVVSRRATRIMAEFYGTRRAIVVCEDDSALALRYRSVARDSQIQDPPSLPQTNCFPLPASQRFSSLCADESSGRVVLFDVSAHEMVVMDFALMYSDIS